jgi:glycosyltransferase involved in cell wall biosynthesis
MVSGSAVLGGHRNQLLQTAQALRKHGIDAVPCFEDHPSLEGFDLVHGFGLRTTDVRRCRRRGIPVALSTVHWEQWYRAGQYDNGDPIATVQARARIGLSLLREALHGRHTQKCRDFVWRFAEELAVLEAADVLLPNSTSEAGAIVRDLGASTPSHVVPNGVDPARMQRAYDSGAAREYVLCVARYEPHKNQLGLIRALRGTDIPLVLAGADHPHHSGYRDRCAREAGKNVRVLGQVDEAELVRLYAGAKAHVLPSWYETCGLVSLDAAVAGANVATTERGFTHDYFGNRAWYLNPADLRSIRTAVEGAFRAPFQDDLRRHVLDNFTWAHAARATIAAYESVVSDRYPTLLPLPQTDRVAFAGVSG